jgi:hypothetical protein
MNALSTGTCRARRTGRGLATVEFALLLPVLLLLALPVIDIARAIQANMILLSISREGANLAARGSLPLRESSLTIMEALAATAPPLDMNQRGMIYITKIMGYRSKGVVQNVVVEHYRWDNPDRDRGWSASRYSPASAVWNCSSWSETGACRNIPPPATAIPVAYMQGTLADGEVIHVVESFYQISSTIGGIATRMGGVSPIGPDLSAMVTF